MFLAPLPILKCGFKESRGVGVDLTPVPSAKFHAATLPFHPLWVRSSQALPTLARIVTILDAGKN